MAHNYLEATLGTRDWLTTTWRYLKAVWKGLIVHEGTRRLAHNYLYAVVDSMEMAHYYLEVPEGSRLTNNYY